MALGEVLGEASGKIAAIRVLPDGKFEVSVQGSGTLLGSEMTDMITYTAVMRPNGTVYGDAHEMAMSTDGDGLAVWTGAGVGKPTARGGWRYPFGGAYQSASSQKWARLLEVYIVGEYEVDENGNYHWKTWEWKY